MAEGPCLWVPEVSALPDMGSGFQASEEGFWVQGQLNTVNLTGAMNLGVRVLSPAGGIGSTDCLFPVLAKSILKFHLWTGRFQAAKASLSP